MNRYPALIAILPSILGIAMAADWLPSAMQERERSMSELETARQQAERDFHSLGAPAPATPPSDDSMPDAPDGGTVAVADGGILFDANNSRLAYLGNVRVHHPFVQLKCKQRLYIQFPNRTLKKGQEHAQDAIKGSAPPQREKSKAAPSAPQAETPPLCIQAGVGMVDGTGNRLYLVGKPELHLQRGTCRALLTPALPQGTPARILADANGDILAEAGELTLEWTDKEGRPCRLHHQGGAMYYRAAARTLLLQGATEIQTPDGGLSCQEEIRLILQLADTPRPPADSFMGQFTGVSIVGIEYGEALGQARAFRPALGNQPAASVAGDCLRYNGQTGECEVSGNQTTLAYGDNTVGADGSIHLAPNGDVTLQGQHIAGNYARPGNGKGQEPIRGHFQTKGPIRFIAETGSIHLPNGIEAKDAYGSLLSGGAMELALQRNPKATMPDRKKTGMLNLALATYNGISRLHAANGIDLQYADTPGSEGLRLLADTADMDFATGEATLTATAGRQAIVRHNGYSLAAHSPEAASTLHLSPNGDLDMQGEEITAELPLQGGQALASCQTRLHLARESGKLEMGRGAHLESEDVILNSRGPLALTLEPGDPAAARPAVPHYPQLTYNFSGLRYADTQQGGTLQTKQASMQCTGAIHVEMAPPGQRDSRKPESGIRTARAEGHVAIAGKDASGRTVTATGDKVAFDGTTGIKRLTGSRVTLQDSHNTHIASGSGASIVIDGKNNARISGAKQSTSATRIHEQIEQQKKTEER